MGERHYISRGADQPVPSRSQYDIPPPQFTKLVAPRKRYRSTQYDHPMYDVVEDDEYAQDAPLDSFDERMLQQPHEDRHHHAVHGRSRLSLAPASSGYFEHADFEEERPPPRMQQTKQVLQATSEDRDSQVYPAKTVSGVLSRFAYNADQSLESSSDIHLGASSSPAFNAGRRRIGQNELDASQQGPAFQVSRRQSAMSGVREDMSYGEFDDEVPIMSEHLKINRPFQQVASTDPRHDQTNLSNVLPTVQGISLVPISTLPDRLRTVFPFATFNAVQSKCFDRVFRSNDNFVLASPTGSGKTAILELAICRAVAMNTTGQYKVVYQAPTKALCSERQRDWEKKFTQIGLRCAELTGDSDASDLRNVQSANIIITTPEKWDSMTRKWKDHEKLMKLVKLFLIDEVHILKEDRGAVLEVVVSRMKSIGTDVRFVSLSATIPNFHDIAAWLGKNSVEPYEPAPNEKFGEEFRPVKLRRHVCGYQCNNGNDFAFEKQLDSRLPDIIARYSEGKPMMIFCATRKSCVNTARLIASWWGSRNGRARLWNPPAHKLHTQDKELRDMVVSGVAFHHAGLEADDRVKVETGFLGGDISVICCTSTLAVGVNLPCHLVIIKNTVSWNQSGMREYSDLEMMQMLGRAGRPQFDDSAVAVIMTRQTKVRRYETLVTGEETLESKLHLNLIDHMNAEIGLGTIRDLESARNWLTGTFLYVRLQQNPVYYKLEGSRSGQGVQEQVDDICFRDITLLREHELVTGEDHFRCSEYGHAMARYYVHFETMKVFLSLQPKATLSEIRLQLSAIALASEFSKIRFRQGEKSLYKALNQSPSIRFPIPVNLDLPAQKVSLIIQSILGCADIPWNGDTMKHRQQYNQEVAMINKSINSLIRCIINCQICSGDSVSIHNALMLERCIGSKAWDDSPMQMMQVPNIGAVAVRKLVNAGIRGIEDLEATEARRIETIVGRNPPFGLKVLNELTSFPKLRVSLHIQPSSVTKTPEGVKIQVRANIGFINEKPPERFGGKVIYVCLLAESSDGRKLHFARIHGSKLGFGQSLVFPADLTSPDQQINCYLMCEGIAGSMKGATVAPKLSPSTFPPQASKAVEPAPTHKPNMSRRRIENAPIQRKRSIASDDFGDADIDDESLVRAVCEDLDFEHIDNFVSPADAITRDNTAKNKSVKGKDRIKAPEIIAEGGDHDAAPVQLPNGRWACSHKCKEKEACKHYCCKNGMDKLPKKAATKRISTEPHGVQSSVKTSVQKPNKTQTKLQLQASKRRISSAVEELDLTHQEKKRKSEYAISRPRDYRGLSSLHRNVQQKVVPSSLHLVMHKKPTYCYGEGGEHQLSFLNQPAYDLAKASSEYGDSQYDEDVPEALNTQKQNQPAFYDEQRSFHFSDRALVASRGSETFGDDDSVFGEAIVGLADSQDLQQVNLTGTSSAQHGNARTAINVAEEFSDIDFPVDIDFDSIKTDPPKQRILKSLPRQCQMPTVERLAPVFHSSSSPMQQFSVSKNARQVLEDGPPRELQQGKVSLQYAGEAPGYEDEKDDSMRDLLSLLDDSLAEKECKVNVAPRKQISAIVEPSAQSVQSKETESTKVPEAFEDLQPWLFEEFGDIVELVEE